jgi:hypothetical protein
MIAFTLQNVYNNFCLFMYFVFLSVFEIYTIHYLEFFESDTKHK